MNERPHDERSIPSPDHDAGLEDEELQVLGAVAAASVPTAAPPAGLRDRILARARDQHFSFIREPEGIWLPRPDAPVATKALFHDSRDRLTTRLVRLGPGTPLPPSQLGGRRSCYVLLGAIASGETTLTVGDFVESVDGTLEWGALERSLILDFEEVVAAAEKTRVLRASEEEWLVPFDRARARLLADGHDKGRELCILQMEPGAVLAAHEHHGIEELFIIRGSCEVEGQRMQVGDYHRAVLGSAHRATRTLDEGCAALVALRDPSRIAA